MHLEYSFTIAATPKAIYEHLMVAANYVALAPLVIAVRDVREDAGVIHYTAVEKFMFLGFIRHDNAIAATLEGDPNTFAIWGDVVSPGGVTLNYSYSLVANGSGADVVDAYELHAPFGLRRFAARKAGEAQRGRAAELRRRLE